MIRARMTSLLCGAVSALVAVTLAHALTPLVCTADSGESLMPGRADEMYCLSACLGGAGVLSHQAISVDYLPSA